MGVKPQGEDTVKQAALHKLAQYLTGEQCQMERFEALSWGPANNAAAQNEAVLANPGLVALNLQNQYAVPQGQIDGQWWDIAKVISSEVKEAKSEADLKAALENYYNKISAIFEMSAEEKNAWGVIGGICGSMWDKDFPMTEVSDGVWESEVLELHQGETFKCRKGASWDENIGDPNSGDPDGNAIVPEDGSFIVHLDVNAGTIELIKQ
jgi:arabinogalactan oligomer/maltooligosaccharide transport system substrate-binding protein